MKKILVLIILLIPCSVGVRIDETYGCTGQTDPDYADHDYYEIQCCGIGEPIPEITIVDDKNQTYDDEGGKVTIDRYKNQVRKSIVSKNFSTYARCIVFNENGRVMKDIPIKPSVILNVAKEQAIASTGLDIKLQVFMKNDQDMFMWLVANSHKTWKKLVSNSDKKFIIYRHARPNPGYGPEVTDESHYKFNEKTGECWINNFQTNDVGVYELSAKTNVGWISKYIFLCLRASLKINDDRSMVVGKVDHDLLIVQCVANGCPTATIHFTNDQGIEFTSSLVKQSKNENETISVLTTSMQTKFVTCVAKNEFEEVSKKIEIPESFKFGSIKKDLNFFVGDQVKVQINFISSVDDLPSIRFERFEKTTLEYDEVLRYNRSINKDGDVGEVNRVVNRRFSFDKTESRFEIASFREDDASIYRIGAKGNFGWIFKTFSVDISAIPSIVKEKTFLLGPLSHKYLKFQCTAYGSPSPNIKFYDERNIHLKSTYLQSASYQHEKIEVLYVKANATKVTCRAKNEHGTDSLETEVQKSVTFGNYEKEQTFTSGKDAIIAVQIIALSLPDIRWERYDARAKKFKKVVLYHELFRKTLHGDNIDSMRYNIDKQSGNLLIKNIGKADGGFYRVNGNGNTGWSSRSVTVAVKLKAQILHEKTFLKQTGSHSLYTVQCVALGSSTISFLTDKREAYSTTEVYRDNEDSIDEEETRAVLSSKQQTSYVECVAENTFSKDSLKIYLPSTVTLKRGGEKQIFDFGKTAVVIVNIQSKHQPEITWEKFNCLSNSYERIITIHENKSIDYYKNGNKNEYGLHKNGSLKIFDFQASDIGFYRCKIKTYIKDLSQTINVAGTVDPSVMKFGARGSYDRPTVTPLTAEKKEGLSSIEVAVIMNVALLLVILVAYLAYQHIKKKNANNVVDRFFQTMKLMTVEKWKKQYNSLPTEELPTSTPIIEEPQSVSINRQPSVRKHKQPSDDSNNSTANLVPKNSSSNRKENDTKRSHSRLADDSRDNRSTSRWKGSSRMLIQHSNNEHTSSSSNDTSKTTLLSPTVNNKSRLIQSIENFQQRKGKK